MNPDEMREEIRNIVREELQGRITQMMIPSGTIRSRHLADDTFPHVVAYKENSNQIVRSSTTLVNDTHLFFSMQPRESYSFSCMLRHQSNTTADIKFNFSVPTGAIIHGFYSIYFSTFREGDTLALATTSTNPEMELVTGVIMNGDYAGNVQLQWAQGTSTAVDTKVLEGSYLLAHKIKG